MPVFHKSRIRSVPPRNCSICMRDSNEPIVLSCNHTFCQPCIHSQVDRLTKLVANEEPIVIACPYCRDFLVSNLNTKARTRGKHYITLDVSPERLHITRPKSAYVTVTSEPRSIYAGKTHRCQPCAEGHSYEMASFWCYNCSEYFCSVCARYHQSMKMSHDHIVKTIRDKERYGNIKSKVAAISRPQTTKLTTMNKQHCEPCHVNSNIKTAEFLCQQCKERMCADCAKSHQSMKMSKTHTMVSMKEVRSKFESRLSLDVKCERHKGENLSMYCKRCRTSCCSKCASAEHTNCGGKAVKIETTSSTTAPTKPAIKPDEGKGKVEAKIGPIRYSWDGVGTSKPAEDKTISFSISPDPKPKVSIPKNKMALRKRRIAVEYSKQKDWIISFAILRDGDILLIQLYEPVLKMISPDGDLLDAVRFYGDPWSVAAHKDSLAVVSFSGRKQLQLVHITRSGLEIGRKLATRHKSLAVCFAKNLIVTTCWEGCVHVINISGDELCYLDTDHTGERLFTNPEYIGSDVTGSVVYVTDYKRNSVTALTVLPSKIVSKPLFVFKDTELKGPKGVAVDKSGVVYVSGMSSRNIFRLSPSGTVIQVYRRREDTDYYEALAVTPEADKLLVSTYEECNILEFKMSY